jgi:hypothetical protein
MEKALSLYLWITEQFTIKNWISQVHTLWAHDSVVGWGTMLQAGRSRVWFQMRSFNFSIDLILPATLGPGVDLATNKNEYQESSWG